MSIDEFTGTFSKEAAPYTTFHTTTLNLIQDAKALGLYCYLNSLPGDYPSINELAEHFNCSLNDIKNSLNYLKQLGILITDKE